MPLSPDIVAVSSVRSAQRGHAIVSYAFRSPSRHHTTPLLIGPLARHLAINCGLGLLLRNAGGDLRFLAIDATKADITISPSWPRRKRLAIYLRHRKAKRACCQRRGP